MIALGRSFISRRVRLIPSFNASGVLPPYSGADPTVAALVSPYKATILELCQRFSTSKERVDLLKLLLEFRGELRQIGVTRGKMWIDGSFIEDVETIRARPPADIDVVTMAHRPLTNVAQLMDLVSGRPDLFDSRMSKLIYKMDAYFIDMSIDPFLIVGAANYYFGLFSHQRDTSLWKGLVELELACNDDEAEEFLAKGAS